MNAPRRRIRADGCTVLALLCATAATAAAPPAEVFGALPEDDFVVLSPDGNTLALAHTTAGDTKVVVLDVASRRVKRTQFIAPTLKLRDLNWSDDATLLIEVSVSAEMSSRRITRWEFFRILALDVNTGQTRSLLMTNDTRSHVTGLQLVALRTPRPKTVVMSTLDWSAAARAKRLGTRLTNERRDSGWVASLFEVDTRSGEGALLEQGTPYTSDWVVDQEGRPAARGEWDSGDKSFRIMVRRGLGWHELLRRDGADPLGLEGLTSDGTALVALGALAQGARQLLAIPMDGAPPHVLLEEPDSEVLAVVRDRFTRTPLGAYTGGALPEIRWFDPQAKTRQEALQKVFPNLRVVPYSESQDKQRVIALVSDAAMAPAYYLVDFRTHKTEIVGETYPALGAAALGIVRITSFRARDGTQIPAYLTLPPGSEGRKLPLVVLPHGGPESRDWPQFDWWSQFLATRGYAVLQPQFRGSTGFGEAYRLAGRRQWGGLMQDDVTDGVQALIADGTADPGRVCIVGGSYGGYAALAGATFTPQLYHCVASINGVSDLADMLQFVQNRGGSQSDSLAYWHESIGPHLDPKIVENSPVHAADRVTAPVLIIYSADDTVVAPSQSENMARALKEAGKNVTLVKLDGDDHWLSHGATRVRMLQELEKFLAAQLHP